MIKNNKGFSLIEIFAMILITTVIIYPLLQSLVKNIEINDKLNQFRNATNIADSALYTIDKLNYTNLEDEVDTENLAGEYYILLSLDECSTILISTEDIRVCEQLFNSVWNNLELTNEQFKLYIYSYFPTQDSIDILLANNLIPLEVKSEMDAATTYEEGLIINPNLQPNTTLLNIVVWIEYYYDPTSVVVISGVIFDE